jgi:hypothetical protein
MADLFISYAREDSARASAIASALEAEGFSVFWDSEIPAGQTWADFIETKLRNSAAVLVLWSAHSIQSQWVREEARMGRDAGKLIPVQLDGSMPPFGFGEVQAANLQTWAGDRADTGWQRLVGAIRFAIEKNGQTPPRPVPPPAPAPAPPPAQPAFLAATPAAEASGAAGAGKIRPIWLIGGGGLALLGVIAVLVGAGGGFSTPSYDGGDVTQSQAVADYGSLTPAVEDVLDQAQQAEADAASIAQEAAGDYQAGAEAAHAAMSGQFGYGSQQLPDGTVVAGDLAGMMSGQSASVGVANPIGIQFYGAYQQLGPTDYTMTGRATIASAVADGHWEYTASTYRFTGVATLQGRYVASGSEEGPTNGAGGVGAGSITYSDGSRYVGEYRSVGQLDQAQYLRHGLGAVFSATGDLMEAGRYDNDAWSAEE